MKRGGNFLFFILNNSFVQGFFSGVFERVNKAMKRAFRGGIDGTNFKNYGLSSFGSFYNKGTL